MWIFRHMQIFTDFKMAINFKFLTIFLSQYMFYLTHFTHKIVKDGAIIFILQMERPRLKKVKKPSSGSQSK